MTRTSLTRFRPPRREEALGGGAEHGAGRRHDYGCGNTLVRDVPDDEAHAAGFWSRKS